MTKWIIIIAVIVLIVEAALIDCVYEKGYGDGFMDGIARKEKEDGEKDKEEPM